MSLSAQNSSFSANWICREGVDVKLMDPAEELYVVPVKTTSFGYEKLG